MIPKDKGKYYPIAEIGQLRHVNYAAALHAIDLGTGHDMNCPTGKILVCTKSMSYAEHIRYFRNIEFDEFLTFPRLIVILNNRLMSIATDLLRKRTRVLIDNDKERI